MLTGMGVILGTAAPMGPRPYDILSDGRVVFVETLTTGDQRAVPLNVVINWFNELTAKLPAAK